MGRADNIILGLVKKLDSLLRVLCSSNNRQAYILFCLFFRKQKGNQNEITRNRPVKAFY